MATPRKTAEKIIDAEIVPEEISLSQLAALGTEPEPEPVPDDIAFTNLLADIGASEEGGRVNVYKLEKGVYRDKIFLFDCAPGEFEISMLQNPDYHEDGYHDFHIVARNRTGIVKGKVLKVMPKKDFAAKASAYDPAAVTEPILQTIQAMQENTNRLIAAMMAQNTQQPQKTTHDMLNEMLLMKQILGGDRQQLNPMEMMRTAVELARDIAQPEGGSSSSDVMMKLLDKFGGPIAEAVAQMPANPPQPVMMPRPVMVAPPPVIVNPIPTANPVTEPVPVAQTEPQSIQETSTTEETEDMSIKLKMGLAFLVKQAKDDADPFLYASLVLDQVGPEISQYVDMPNWLDALAQFNPDVKKYPEWFEEMRQEIKNQLTESAGQFTTDENLSTEAKKDVPEHPDNSDAASNT